MGRHRYRQLFLFLGVLIFPAIMITVQGRRILAQEKELAKTRLEEIQKRTAAEIGQEIVTRLERIKTQEMANTPEALSKHSDLLWSSSDGWTEIGWYGHGIVDLIRNSVLRKIRSLIAPSTTRDAPSLARDVMIARRICTGKRSKERVTTVNEHPRGSVWQGL